MSHSNTMLLSIPVGVAGAVAIVIFQSIAADVVGGALAIAALIVVTRSAIQLAGELGGPDDEPSSGSRSS
jgi:hypothetical protein